MTDPIAMECVSTQTLIPRYPGGACFEDYERNRESQHSQLIQKCSETEKQLIKHLEKLRNTVNPPSARSKDNELFRNKITGLAKETIISPGETDTDTTTDTILSLGSTERIPKLPLDYSKYCQKLLYPTRLSWHFEYDTDLPVYSNKFSAYTITANKPWNSFIPVSYSQYQGIDLNSLLESIDLLVLESNQLADLIEYIIQSKKRSECRILDTVPENLSKFEPYVHIPPSEYWLPIIEDQEKTLAELQSAKGTDMAELEKYLEKI